MRRSLGFSLVGVRAGAQLMMDPHLAKEAASQLKLWADQRVLVPHVYRSVSLSAAQEAFRAVNERQVVGKAVIALSDCDSVTAKL